MAPNIRDLEASRFDVFTALFHSKGLTPYYRPRILYKERGKVHSGVVLGYGTEIETQTSSSQPD